jgi:hypothetical protein
MVIATYWSGPPLMFAKFCTKKPKFFTLTLTSSLRTLLQNSQKVIEMTSNIFSSKFVWHLFPSLGSPYSQNSPNRVGMNVLCLL